MSSDLEWEPKHREAHALGDDLKFALRKKYDNPVRADMDEDDLTYIYGLRDAGLKDADKLISAIKKFGTIEVRENF